MLPTTQRLIDRAVLHPVTSATSLLDPVRRALSAAAVHALRDESHTWDIGTAARSYWEELVAGLQGVGALGYGLTTNGWVIIWEVYTEDDTYWGRVSDRYPDLFSAAHANLVKHTLFAS